MSDRQIAKNRFHRGLSAYLRRTLRKSGVALDEEMAQFVLGGVEPFSSQVSESLLNAVNQTFAIRRELMTQWEHDNPGKRPYAPSFPERVLPIVREAIRQSLADDGNPAYLLEQLVVMCVKELEASPVSIDPLLLTDTEA